MFKYAALMISLCVSLCAGDFQNLLSKGGGDMQYVQTPEDRRRLGMFSALFDMAQKREHPVGSMTKTLHFIWLGPSAISADALRNMKSWIDRHPGWTMNMWTDQPRDSLDARVHLRGFEEFPLNELEECYFLSDNFGERSELLRYAVLLSEGGVYIDHDALCIAPIDALQESHDFFCGMEPLGASILSSSVNPSPHLLGATPQHPILLSAKKWLISEWSRLEEEYPGSDPSAILNRVKHRSFRALSVGIKEAHSRAGRKDAVFPPVYFSLPDAQKALFAAHQHLGTWHTQESESSAKVQRLLSDAVAELDSSFLLGIGLIFANVGIGGFFVYKLIRLRRGSK